MKDVALQIYLKMLEALRPASLISSVWPSLSIPDGRLLVCGAGKASSGLAAAFVERLGRPTDGGLVVTKYGHSVPVPGVRVMESSHPYPNEDSVAAGSELLSFARSCSSTDTVFFFLTGGASALIEVPRAPWTLPMIEEATRAMVGSATPIEAINTVRARFSKIKGGGLSRAFGAARVIVLLLDDVNRKGLSYIGSGPFLTPVSDIAPSLVDFPPLPPLTTGDVPKREHIVLADNTTALKAAADVAKGLGFEPFVNPTPMLGHVEKECAAFLEQGSRHRCYFAGGEPLVEVHGSGKGGRCQEFATRAAILLQGSNCMVLAGSTDGTDGPTDIAAALIDQDSVRQSGLDPKECLKNSDSGRFIEASGGAIRTGPTQCNVNDVYMLLKS